MDQPQMRILDMVGGGTGTLQSSSMVQPSSQVQTHPSRVSSSEVDPFPLQLAARVHSANTSTAATSTVMDSCVSSVSASSSAKFASSTFSTVVVFSATVSTSTS